MITSIHTKTNAAVIYQTSKSNEISRITGMGGNDAHGLIRFDNLFGTGDGQIALGSDIISASLTIDVTDASVAGANIRFFRMLSTWDETSTWNSMTNGIQTDDVEASSTADATVLDASVTGLITLTGLEDTLQAWSDGDTNYGWAVQIDNTDSWIFRSSENGTNHPKLTVEYRTTGGDTATGLLGHWDFDTNANDASGNNYNGTLTNGASIDTTDITDQVGVAKLSLDGTNDYVDLDAHVSNFSSLTEGTISAWVKMPETRSGEGTIFSINDTNDVQSRITFKINAGHGLKFAVIENGTQQFAVNSTSILNDATWRHVAVTVNSSGNTQGKLIWKYFL